VRIIAGSCKGRRLTAPPGGETRPTSDRTREAVFNVLAHGIDWPGLDDAVVLDLYAGSGALGLEALSRGARHATFIDNADGALKVARRNAAELGLWRQATLLGLDATRLAPPPLAAQCPAALAFLDPPYSQDLVLPALLGLAGKGWIGAGSIIVAEMSSKETMEPPKGYELLDERTYGAARVLFLERSA